MPALHCIALPRSQRPLLDKFYRAHGSPMRAAGEGQAWVARAETLVAALCLTPMDQGLWLTGLFVAPAHRRQAIARTLVHESLASHQGPVWLFCDPRLIAFYQPLGFAPCGVLPAPLASRLARYRRSKSLVALSREGTA